MRPIDFLSARIVWRFRPELSHAVYAAEHFRFPQLRRRATELVPAAGVDHDQAAVGVDLHVGWMEVDEVRRDEIVVLARVCAAQWLEHVARYFAHVELAE